MKAPARERESVIRCSPGSMEVRAAGDGEPAKLTGHFAVFNQPTRINSVWEGGPFMETVAPGAFRKTFKENGPNIKLLLEHGADPRVAQRPLGRITSLMEDEHGARYEAELYDAEYVNELLPALRDGAYSASFRFRSIREDVDEYPEPSDSNPDGIPERTLREVSVAEFGPVLFPAYAGATAQARSLTDEFKFGRFLSAGPDRLAEITEFWRSRAAEAPLDIDGDSEPVAEPVEPTVDEERAELEAALTEATERVDEVRAALDAITELPAADAVEETVEVAPTDDESVRRDEAPAAPPTTGTRKATRSYLNRKDGATWKLP